MKGNFPGLSPNVVLATRGSDERFQMATSQNGWSVLFSAPSGTMRWITGRIRPGDVDTVFEYLCARLNKIERCRPEWSWGWNVRAIRGKTSGYSNHASATAIDYNAPAHPLGVTGTWSAKEKDAINRILADMNGVIRWGENYSGRKDGMHFEINRGPLAVKLLARKIRAGKMPDQQPAWEPKPAYAVNFGRVQEQFLIAVGAQKGTIVRLNGVGLIQRALNSALPGTSLVVDGRVGEETLNAWGRWEKISGGSGRPRVPDRTSVEALAKEANFDLTGETWES